MRASVGDRLVIKGHHVGEPDRDAEVLEVHGQDGTPPYVVRWSEDGHEGLYGAFEREVLPDIEQSPAPGLD